MPIYSYRCEACGHQQDFLQKMSDPLLVTCPACGQPALKKQVTAAGFQLKGSGWYVTDFRNPAGKEAAKAVKPDGDGKTESPGETKPATTDTPAPAKSTADSGASPKTEAAPPKPAAPAAPSGST